MICLAWVFITLTIGNNSIKADEFYFHKVYIPFRKLWYQIFGGIDIPLLYLWLIFVVLVVILIVKECKRITIWGFHIAFMILAHFLYFYIAWGFNYNRLSISERLKLKEPINKLEFESEVDHAISQVNSIRSKLNHDLDFDWNTLKNDMEQSVSLFLKQNQLQSLEKVSSKALFPRGSLLVLSTAGVYWPFAGESMIDAGLHPIEVPFTMAHELAHGMGWTDEGECNWIAYESCIRSKLLRCNYSGNLSYLKYLLHNIPEVDSLLYTHSVNKLSKEVRSDLDDIRRQHDKYPDFIPGIRNALYNWYLKSNQVSSGLESYNEIIMLSINFRKKRTG
ncbi:MAG: DUF3810 family protein [Saprospiraceae bacterium]|nr:DUF3810 family protein [Saprospiraceae bacterium]